MFHKIVNYDLLKVNNGTGRIEANAALSYSDWRRFQAVRFEFEFWGMVQDSEYIVYIYICRFFIFYVQLLAISVPTF